MTDVVKKSKFAKNHFTLYIKDNVMRQVKALAEISNRSISQQINYIIKKYLLSEKSKNDVYRAVKNKVVYKGDE